MFAWQPIAQDEVRKHEALSCKGDCQSFCVFRFAKDSTILRSRGIEEMVGSINEAPHFQYFEISCLQNPGLQGFLRFSPVQIFCLSAEDLMKLLKKTHSS